MHKLQTYIYTPTSQSLMNLFAPNGVPNLVNIVLYIIKQGLRLMEQMNLMAHHYPHILTRPTAFLHQIMTSSMKFIP